MHQTTKDLRRGFAITILPVGLLLLLAGMFRFLSDHPAAEDEEAPQVLPHKPSRPHHPPPTPRPLFPVDDKTQKAAEATVGGQIDAMTRGDFQGALKFATEEARQSWNGNDFQTMILRSYLPLAQAKVKRFGRARGTPGFCVLPVTIIDDVGRRSDFLYQLGSRPGGGMEVFGCSQVFVGATPDTTRSFPMPRAPRRSADEFDPI